MTEQEETPIVNDTSPESEYHPPALIELGTVEELTLGGANSGFDGMEGHS
jgi:hypothetical protein